MGKGLTMTLRGAGAVLDKLGDLRQAANQDLQRAVRTHAEDVIAESQEHHVPVMDGTLRSSAYVSSGQGGGVVWAKLGFSAAHARSVHENPRAGKTGGVSPSGQKYKKWAKVGGWKFLERPLRASESRFLMTVSAVLRAAWLKRLGGGA